MRRAPAGCRWPWPTSWAWTPATAWVSGGDNLAFLSAMAPVTMGGTGEAARTLVRSVGPGQPRLRRARLAAGVLGDPKGAARSMSAHCEVGARPVSYTH